MLVMIEYMGDLNREIETVKKKNLLNGNSGTENLLK